MNAIKLQTKINKLQTKLNNASNYTRSTLAKVVIELLSLETQLEQLQPQPQPQPQPQVQQPEAQPEAQPETNVICTWVVRNTTRRQEPRKLWVAHLVGKDEKFTFKRNFLEISHLEWGRYGMSKAEFEITTPGYYQDVDGDYFRVSPDGESEIISYMEVKDHFYHIYVK